MTFSIYTEKTKELLSALEKEEITLHEFIDIHSDIFFQLQFSLKRR